MMNYDLVNQYIALSILDMLLGYAFLISVAIVFLVLFVYYGINEYLEEKEWERSRKRSLENLKEVQDRFKDDDMR